jgi:hypothetical protein
MVLNDQSAREVVGKWLKAKVGHGPQALDITPDRLSGQFTLGRYRRAVPPRKPHTQLVEQRGEIAIATLAELLGLLALSLADRAPAATRNSATSATSVSAFSAS